MALANPYAPPSSHVADVTPGDDAVQPVRTWSASGRIGRMRYLAHLVVAYLLLFVLGFVAGFAEGAAGLKYVSVIAVGVGGVAYLVFLVLKSIQRSHDMGWTGWTALLALIPFVGLLWIFVPGTRGTNRFGAPPPPNTLGVTILGLLFPLLAIVGILAAVAIPAYQDYVKRAQAVQGR